MLLTQGPQTLVAESPEVPGHIESGFTTTVYPQVSLLAFVPSPPRPMICGGVVDRGAPIISRCIIEHETDSVMPDFRAERDFDFPTPRWLLLFFSPSFQSFHKTWWAGALGLWVFRAASGMPRPDIIIRGTFPGIGELSRGDSRQ